MRYSHRIVNHSLIRYQYHILVIVIRVRGAHTGLLSRLISTLSERSRTLSRLISTLSEATRTLSHAPSTPRERSRIMSRAPSTLNEHSHVERILKKLSSSRFS